MTEQLDQALRLACQVKIENHGDVVVMTATRPETTRQPTIGAELTKEIRRAATRKKARDADAVGSDHDVRSVRFGDREATRVRIQDVRCDHVTRKRKKCASASEKISEQTFC